LDKRLKRTRVSTILMRSRSSGVIRPTLVIAPGEQLQGCQLLLHEARLDEDAPADRNHRVRRQHVGVGHVLVVGDLVARGLGLGAGEAGYERARHLALERRLVDGGGTQRIGLDADLAQKYQTPRRSAGQHQLGLEPGAATGRLGARELVPQRLPPWPVATGERGGQAGFLCGHDGSPQRRS
jgi:hypothetical protein